VTAAGPEPGGAGRPGGGLAAELAVAALVAERAGRMLLDAQRRGAFTVGAKAGGEVVTTADRGADLIVRDGIAAAFPDDAIFSEETPDDSTRLAARRVWIVDPLDATSAFVAGDDGWSVSVGLAVDGRAAVGAVASPAGFGLVAGMAAGPVTRNGAAAAVVAPASPPRLTASRRDLDRLPPLPAAPRALPGMAGKLARVAAGLDDGVVTAVRRKEWGVCAGVALVTGAGGRVTLWDGTPVRFNRRQPRQPLGIVAAGPGLHALLLRAVAGAAQ